MGRSLRILSFGRANFLKKRVVGNDPRVVPPQSTTNLNRFYPVAGARRKPTKSRSMGCCAGAAGNSSTEYGYTKICTNEKHGAKIPLLKVLEGS